MELTEIDIEKFKLSHLLFNLPEHWEKERGVEIADRLRAIESSDRENEFTLVVDSFQSDLTISNDEEDDNQEILLQYRISEQPLAIDALKKQLITVLADGSISFCRILRGSLDMENGTVTIKWKRRDEKSDDLLNNRIGIKAFAYWDWVPVQDKTKSLLKVLTGYIESAEPNVAREIIGKNKPKTGDIVNYLVDENTDVIEPMFQAVKSLDNSYLPIQGPPGTGKTFVGSHIISKLLTDEGAKPRIAIVSESWAAIDNLFESTIEKIVTHYEAEDQLKGREITLRISGNGGGPLKRFGDYKRFIKFSKNTGVKFDKMPNSDGSLDDEAEPEWFRVEKTQDGKEIRTPLPNGPDVENGDLNSKVHLLATTSWPLVNPEMRQACSDKNLKDKFIFDYVFIDEAGQFSLADTLALSHSAKNIVLLGDPKQLPQVTKAMHEGGAGLSVMEYLIGREENIKPSSGFYLGTTWRMRPEITDYISEQFYDKSLKNHEVCAKREILEMQNGVYFCQLKSENYSTKSETEALKVLQIIEQLLERTFKDSSSDQVIERKLLEKDFMVVAPFNDQVSLVKEKLEQAKLPNVRVGTVNKFQGQEAPIVIYTLTSSSKDEIPTGRSDFLFLPNRINVAVSRAQCLAVVVGSEDLLDAQPTSIEEMKFLNNLCRIFNKTPTGKGISLNWDQL